MFVYSKMESCIKVRVIPRAQKTEIYEVLSDGTYKIRVKEKPEKSQANKALIKYLSTVLKIPRSSVRIISGDTARQKLISIQDIEKEQIDILLSDAMNMNEVSKMGNC